MKRPLGYSKINLKELSHRELKTYLKVLQDKSSWNYSLKYAVNCGDIVVIDEICNIKELLNN